jgi:hypothetical protein
MPKRTKPLHAVEVDDEEPQSTLKLPLDWAGTLNLNKSVKSLRLLLDKEGNVIGFPVVLVNPATGGLETVLVSPADIAAIAAAVWASATKELTSAKYIARNELTEGTLDAGANFELVDGANIYMGMLSFYSADAAFVVQVKLSTGWVTIDTFATKKLITVAYDRNGPAGTLGNLRILNNGLNNAVQYALWGYSLVIPS